MLKGIAAIPYSENRFMTASIYGKSEMTILFFQKTSTVQMGDVKMKIKDKLIHFLGGYTKSEYLLNKNTNVRIPVIRHEKPIRTY